MKPSDVKGELCLAFKLGMLNMMKGDVFKVALYDEKAKVDQTTKEYSALGEISGSGYVKGGLQLDLSISSAGPEALCTFNSIEIQKAKITARKALIYNATRGFAVAFFDFAENKVAAGGTFAIDFPALENALIRF